MTLWLKAIWQGFLMSLIVDLLVALGMVTIPLLMVCWPLTWGVCTWIRHEQLLEEEKKKGK